jgi:hypothetical protein
MRLPDFHLKRYRQIAALLWKYDRSDLAEQMSTEEGFGLDEPPPANGRPPLASAPPSSTRASPEQLADDLEAMGRPSSNWARSSRAARICSRKPTRRRWRDCRTT